MKRSLIPWRRGESAVPVRREEDHPFLALHENMNRLFDSFFSDFEGAFGRTDLSGAGRPGFAVQPRLDVAESESEVTVTADLPGLTEKDVEVSLDRDVLTIRGRRELEREEKKHNYHVMERSYGEFHRVVPVPESADGTKAKATFKNGVLKLVMPKKPEAASQRRLIPVAAA